MTPFAIVSTSAVLCSKASTLKAKRIKNISTHSSVFGWLVFAPHSRICIIMGSSKKWKLVFLSKIKTWLDYWSRFKNQRKLAIFPIKGPNIFVHFLNWDLCMGFHFYYMTISNIKLGMRGAQKYQENDKYRCFKWWFVPACTLCGIVSDPLNNAIALCHFSENLLVLFYK